MIDLARDDHRDDLRDDYRDDQKGQIVLSHHGLNTPRDDRDDDTANSTTRTRRRENVGKVPPLAVPAVPGVPTQPDDAARLAHAARWRAEEARRIAIMGPHAGTAEGVRLLMQHDPDHRHAHSVLAAMERGK